MRSLDHLDRTIAQIRKTMDTQLNEVEENDKKLNLLIQMKAIKEKRLKGIKLTLEELEEVLSLLCWGSLAGCCDPVKECPWNMSVCEVLGIDPYKLYEVKKKSIDEFLSFHFLKV